MVLWLVLGVILGGDTSVLQGYKGSTRVGTRGGTRGGPKENIFYFDVFHKG